MAIDKVKKYFRSAGKDGAVLEFDVSSATVELAAAAVGCAPPRIAKTLSFQLGEQVALIVAAGDAKVDNARFKRQFGVKASMLPADQAGARVGHEVGGICPFAVNPGVQIYLDDSLRRFETVYPAAGSANSAIELTIAELERFSGSLGWVDVCKDWRPPDER